MSIVCQNCGHVYDDADTTSGYEFASTTTYSRGDYASPAQISAAGENMTACPRDSFEKPRDRQGEKQYPTGATPSGASMYEGSDRYEAGDEDETKKDNIPPLRSGDDTLEGS